MYLVTKDFSLTLFVFFFSLEEPVSAIIIMFRDVARAENLGGGGKL